MFSPHALLCTYTEFFTPEKISQNPKLTILYRFPWRKCSHELLFCIAVSCQTLDVFGELFFTSQPNGAELEKKMHWQIIALLSTSSYLYQCKVFSIRNANTASCLQIHVTHQKLLDTCGPSGHSRILGCPAKCYKSHRVPGGRISSPSQHHCTVDTETLIQGASEQVTDASIWQGPPSLQ